jgi:DNA-binding beta-propeller fold protein YncE
MGRRAGSGAVIAALVAAVLTGATASSGATGSVELYVSDVAGGTIERVDPSDGTVGPGIPVPQGPFDIDITPNGRTTYTVSGFSNAVVPVDLETSTVDATIPLTCGTQMAIVPGRQKAYVTQGCGTTVTPLDLFTNTPGMPIEVGTRPFGIAVTADGTTAYVATGGNTPTSPNALVPIDVDTDTAGSPIPLGQGGDAIGVAVSPDNSTAFVAMEGNDTVVPVDLVAGAAGTPIQVPPHPAWLALTPDASTLLVTHVALGPTGLGEPAPANVTPIDVATRTVLPDIDLGSQTTGVVITPDGSTAYVNVLADVDTQAAVVPIDVATLTAGTPIPVPGQPYALALRPQPSIDTTPPTVTLETTPASPTGGGGTWFNAEDLDGGSLTVNALGLDPPNGLGGSGVTEVRCLVDGSIHAAVGDELTLTVGAGAHSVSCSAQDTSGNVTDPPVQATYRVDTHAPDFAGAVTGSGPNGAVLLNDPAAVAHANADDGTGSGVASSSCGTPDVSTVGPHTVSCSATDVAGNTSSADVTYVVGYELVGLTPADGTSVRAGKPLKIAVSLADASGAPVSLCAGCSVEVQMFGVEGEGPFLMSYHNGSGEFRSSWKPTANGSGTARIVVSVRDAGTTVLAIAQSVLVVT